MFALPMQYIDIYQACGLFIGLKHPAIVQQSHDYRYTLTMDGRGAVSNFLDDVLFRVCAHIFYRKRGI